VRQSERERERKRGLGEGGEVLVTNKTGSERNDIKFRDTSLEVGLGLAASFARLGCHIPANILILHGMRKVDR
jgi:hypothetical protein